jgi:hypothetical protein
MLNLLPKQSTQQEKKKQFLERTYAGGEEGAHLAVACWGVGQQRKDLVVAGGRRSWTSLLAASR